MLITPQLLSRSVNTLFLYRMAAQQGRPLVGRFAKVVPSTKRKEIYPNILGHAKMREYLRGEEMKFDGISAGEYEIENKKYQAGLRLLREDLEDDEFNALTTQINELTRIAARHDNAMILGAYLLGDEINGADGVPLFSETHPDPGTAGVGVQTNVIPQDGTTVGDVSNNLDEAITMLMSQKTPDGEPFAEDIRQIGVIAGMGIRSALRQAINAETIDNTSNVAFDDVQLDVYFTSRIPDTSFYVVNQEEDLAPVILQTRSPIELINQNTPESSDAAFMHDEYRWKVRKRAGVGYGTWQAAVKVAA